MKGLVIGLAALAALAAAGLAAANLVSVALTPTGPQPGTVTAEWGDTVALVNGDSVTLAVTSPREDLRTSAIPPGATYTSVVTGRAGTFQYRQTGGSKSYSGAVVMTATGTVTLKAASKSILYGQPATISGIASKPGTPVLIEQRSAGDTTWKELQTVTSGASGAFALTLHPAVGTKLRASIAGGQIRSGTLTLAIVPALGLAAAARSAPVGSTVTVSARVTPPKAAVRLTLYECSAVTGGWRSAGVKRPSGGRATFRWKALYGKTLLRVSFAHKDAAPGFEARDSAKIAVTGTGAAPRAKKRTTHGC